MANPVHLEVLKQGIKVWNQWRETNILILPDLSGANLSGIDLSEANLSEVNLIRANLNRAELIGARLRLANLIEANLKEANLFGADLSGAELNRVSLTEANLIGASLNGANLIGADLTGVNLIQASLSESDLSGADLSGANLKQADLRGANLSKASLSKANLMEADLIGAHLWQAGLKDADLTGANLWEADLRGTNLMGTKLVKVDLREANLLQANALDTDLRDSTLTGACIQDLIINHSTRLDGVKCDYVYLRYDYNLPGRFLDRRPLNPNRCFAQSEFLHLVRTPYDTIDLVFGDGIDWQAFFLAFQQLGQHFGATKLAIQAIECKSWGKFVIRLEVDEELDHMAIETFAYELYQSHLQALETDYQERFDLQGQQLENFLKKLEAKRVDNTDLLNMLHMQVTIQEKVVHNIAEYASTPGSTTLTSTISDDKRGKNRGMTEHVMEYVSMNGITPPDLNTLAQEIQVLLDRLSTSHAPVQVPLEAEQEILLQSALKQRILNAIATGGKDTLRRLVSHPAIGVVLMAAEEWTTK